MAQRQNLPAWADPEWLDQTPPIRPTAEDGLSDEEFWKREDAYIAWLESHQAAERRSRLVHSQLLDIALKVMTNKYGPFLRDKKTPFERMLWKLLVEDRRLLGVFEGDAGTIEFWFRRVRGMTTDSPSEADPMDDRVQAVMNELMERIEAIEEGMKHGES